MIPRLALLISLVLLVPAATGCSKGWTNAEEGQCFKSRNLELVDCTSPDAKSKLLKIMEDSSPSIGDCPNGTFTMREHDGKGFCFGSP